MSKMSRYTVLLALVMVAALALPQVASACTTYRCEMVFHPTKPFCLQCVDTGAPTGANCANSGPCGCYFVQCPAFQNAETEASPLDSVLTREPNACAVSDEQPAAERAPGAEAPDQTAA
jgi:hypothetical protein